MKSRPRFASLRRWPSRNFLGELEPSLRDRYALDDLARRDPRLRGLHRRLRAVSRTIEARIGGPDWVRYSDARALLQTAEFELAFNLGFENGLIAGRADTLAAESSENEPAERLRMSVRRALAEVPLAANAALTVLLELAHALALPLGSRVPQSPGS
jgi:hypothetical protein